MATLAFPAAAVPLCVDLDGTLLRTDLLFESLLAAVKRRWWIVFLLPIWMLGGKASLKRRLAEGVELDPALLPYREDLLEWLRVERGRGREIVLVTGSNQKLAAAVAKRLGLFDGVMATDARVNLTGHTKAKRLVSEYGSGGFDYAGDSAADEAVWEHARVKIAAGRAAGRPHRFDGAFAERSGFLKPMVRALRPKHWVKNILVFTPLIAGQHFGDMSLVLRALAAFAAFSLSASGVYVINDLLDLASDRAHPIKRRRPFAAGDLPLTAGFAMAPVLLGAGLAIAGALGAASLGVLIAYLLLTFVYTFYLKRKLLTDVFALALLYTLRMIEGGAATGVLCSLWLLAFSAFQFLSLAFLKRSAELSRLNRTAGVDPETGVGGRSYFTWDLVQVNVFGVTAAYISSLVLGLYMAGDTVRVLYREPAWLWLLVPLHLFWMSRAWILSHRGAMNEDPIVFAFSDRTTLLCGVVAAVLVELATHGGVPIPVVTL